MAGRSVLSPVGRGEDCYDDELYVVNFGAVWCEAGSHTLTYSCTEEGPCASPCTPRLHASAVGACMRVRVAASAPRGSHRMLHFP